MIAFKNGEFEGGDLMDIIHIDWNDAPDHITWYDNMLFDEVAVLEIQRGTGRIKLFEANNENLAYIPRQNEDLTEHYSTFWESAETYVFGDIEEALKFMRVYSGDFENDVKEILKTQYLRDLCEELFLK